jgi:predicted O-methyltransferase YrrM
MPWRVLKYLQHLFYLKYRKGRRIHSPYLFELVHDVIYNARGWKVPDQILADHRALKDEATVIPADTKGAISAVDPSEARTVSSFVRKSSVPEKHGALLYRIAKWFSPDVVLELGTGLGVSTIYLSGGHPGVPVYSFEGNRERAAFAAQLFNRMQMEKITIHWGDIETHLEEVLQLAEGRLLAFVDANHRYDPTIRYVRSIMESTGGEAVIVMDDIYWSKGMYRAWKEIITWPGIRMSVDLFHMGILLLRKDLQKVDLKINF